MIASLTARTCTGIVLLWLLLATSGCALLVRGRHQDVAFHSEPESATISVETASGAATCTTPCGLKLERGRSPFRVRIEKEGYETVSTDLASHVLASPATATLQNLDELLFVPALLDLRTDAFWDYPEEVRVTLSPAGRGEGAAEIEQRWRRPPPDDLPIQ